MRAGRTARRAGLSAVTMVAVLGLPSVARANNWDNDPATIKYNPDLLVTTAPLAGAGTNLNLRISQNKDEDVIGSYHVHIPTGFRFAVGSVPEASIASCKDIDPTSTSVNDQAEGIGPAQVLLETDETTSRVQFLGEMYLLRFAGNVATFCVLVGTFDFSIPFDLQQILFQVDLTFNDDRSWDARWTLASVDPLNPGWHSIYDNPYFQAHRVSIQNVSIQLSGITAGNYATDPGTGEKYKIPFAYNPNDPGRYDITTDLVPCGQNGTDAAYACRSNAPVAHPNELLGIASGLAGAHELPLVQEPALIAGSFARPITGTSLVTVTWKPPADTPAADVKGYLVTTGVPYQPSLIHYDRLITNPAEPGYSAADDPCAADPELCSRTLDFKTMRTTKGDLFNLGRVDGLYSTSVVALFTDGHRSDGRCDDGTPAGTPAPCADGKTPLFTWPGYTYVQYLMRYHNGVPWPLMYGNLFFGPIQIVLVDLDHHEAEYIEPFPYGVGIEMQAFTIYGSNDLGVGTVMYLDNTNTQGKRFGMQAYAAGGLSGYYEKFTGQYDMGPTGPLNEPFGFFWPPI